MVVPALHGRVFEKVEEEIEKDLAAIESLLDRNSVFVTHSPAHGILDKSAAGGSVGSPSIFATIRPREVRAHVHGHIHKCFGRDGKHFNFASGTTFRAMLIDLDGLTHTPLERKADGSLEPRVGREWI